MNWHRLRTDLERHEGRRHTVYQDSEGVATIGIGRNLESVGLSDDEIDYLLGADIRRAYLAAKAASSVFDVLTDRRQEVLVNMAFNLGEAGLKAFRQMHHALAVGDYSRAKAEMLDSLWATQVGARATELAEIMEAG